MGMHEMTIKKERKKKKTDKSQRLDLQKVVSQERIAPRILRERER
jgi:hypothetical protein